VSYSDSGDYTALVLLDLTATFETVDHSVLITRLDQCITGSALDWFISDFNRSFSVRIGEYSSSKAVLLNGSILAPILFSLYMILLGSIIRKHGLSFHFLRGRNSNLSALKTLVR